MSASDFCKNLLSTCAGKLTDGYMTETACETKFGALTPARMKCTSYHVCNAKAGNPTLHCPHAQGADPCN